MPNMNQWNFIFCYAPIIITIAIVIVSVHDAREVERRKKLDADLKQARINTLNSTTEVNHAIANNKVVLGDIKIDQEKAKLVILERNAGINQPEFIPDHYEKP